MTDDVIDIAAMVGGAVLASKGASMLNKVVNKNNESGLKGMIAPGAVTGVGIVGSVLLGNRIAKSVAKGVAIGGAIKTAEKVLKKDNLLSGIDGEALMMPGIGDVIGRTGMSVLPELSHYSENPNAPVTSTGGDYEYHMGTPSEVLSGDDEFFAH